MSCRISVIVPVYNVESYLATCLDSLVHQTLQDIEIILVNDGSTDNSLSIANEYAYKFPKIKIINQTNGGLSDARNTGIKQAQGEYLAFVDSDDWIEKEMMEELYILAKKHSAEIAFCALQNINEKGKVFKLLPQVPQLPEKIILDKDFTIFGEMSCFACNKIFKKELFDGIEFPKGLHFEDIATIPRLLLKATTIAKTNSYFYNYFIRTGSITRNYTAKGMDMFNAIDSVKNDFFTSPYKNHIQGWGNFVILQGFYSFLAYYAYVQDGAIKKQMFYKLRNLIKSEDINKNDIINYKRFDKTYLLTLNLKKIIYYLLQIIRL